MHIGPNKQNCQELKMHDTEMPITETQQYLGDTISSRGYNSVNKKKDAKQGTQQYHKSNQC